MNTNFMLNKKSVFSISAVESEVGISKDVLRKWEARYGFPSPARNKRDERIYNFNQISRLRLIKRFIDKGIRPSKVVPESVDDLMSLAKQIQIRIDGPEESKEEAMLLSYLRTHDLESLRLHLKRLLLKQGLRKFVLDTVAPLTYAVGEAWSQKELEIYEEHLYSEIIQDILRSTVDDLTDNTLDEPRILLTTPPDEAHTLGILMASNMFSLEGARCIFLGGQTPLGDIAGAVLAHRIDIVALSFSIAFSQRRIVPILTKLRTLLPEQVTIWVGGNGVLHLLDKGLEGLTIVPSLEVIREKLLEWKEVRTI